MNKNIVKAMSILTAITMLSACTPSNNSQQSSTSAGGTKPKEITVVSREESSGTRGAFDELMKIKVKEGETEVSKLFEEAVIVTSTDGVSAKVEVDSLAIGYTSLGSVNDKIKAVSIDGVTPTVAAVKSGEYKIARPFVVAAKKPSPLAQDFMNYLVSAQGQKTAADKGYIMEVDGAAQYTASGLTGKITMSGSTSVEKIIEKCREDYVALNPGTEIEVTYSGSGTGIKDATSGKVDIGMSSRDLKDTEKAEITSTIFARDGIAVIVNAQNTITGLTSEQVTKIFKGEIRDWSNI